MFEGIDMFEILMGLGLLWIAWLVSMIWETDYGDTHKRTVQSKTKRNKDVEQTTTTKT